MKFICRCTREKCKIRVTLNKHPLEYRKERVCVSCGSPLRVDLYRMYKEHKRVLCTCDGLHYPHRKGSSIWCTHHPVGPSEEEYYERYKLP